MRRLHVFGCSHTWGQGITSEDCDDANLGDVSMFPSKHSWASNLARSINCELVNHAIPGSSNHQILNQIKKAVDPNFPYIHYHHRETAPLPQLRPNSTDIAAILFSYYNRSVYYTEDIRDTHCDNILTAHPELGRPWKRRTKTFFRLYNLYHLEQISLYDIEHSYLYLKNIGIPFISLFLRPISDSHKSSIMKQIVLDADIAIDDLINQEFKFEERYGADNDHWSTAAHKRIAQIAEQKIQPLITSL